MHSCLFRPQAALSEATLRTSEGEDLSHSVQLNCYGEKKRHQLSVKARPAVTSGKTTYVVSRHAALFPELLPLLQALQGVAIAVWWQLFGTVAHSPGDYVTVEAKHLGCDVHLPLVGPIEAALANAIPEFIHITVAASRSTEPTHLTTQGLLRFTDAIFLPFLVSYFERHRSEIEARYPAGRTAWPAAWQMSWAVRNAFSHNGRVFKKATQPPVLWRGLAFAPSDEPAKGILSLVNGGDILVLMLEMEESRLGTPLPRA